MGIDDFLIQLVKYCNAPATRAESLLLPRLMIPLLRASSHTRRLAGNLPFSSGLYICVGNPLANLSSLHGLPNLFRGILHFRYTQPV